MGNHRFTSVFLFILSFLWFSVNGQNFNQVVGDALQGNAMSELLLPMEDLQNLAVENSPMLKFYDSDISSRELKVKAEKREWMRSLGIEANAKYGLYDNLVIREDLGSDVSNTSTTEQTRYSVGLFLKMPLSSLVDRSNVQGAKAELDKLQYQKESSRKELRQLVIVQYNNVLKANKQLEIRHKSLEMFKLQMLRVEKDFVNGKIHITEYSRIHDMATRAELDFESVKIELITAMQLLQEIVGAPITLKK